jgi:hypothetical protein
MASQTFANGNTSLVHLLDLDEYGLGEINDDQVKERAKREVADYLKNEALRFLDRGTSPVQGEGRFKILEPEYAEKEKGGVRTSNLELEGDLKDSLLSEPATGSFVRFGHQGAQVPKADGHNQLSGKAQRWALENEFPKRRYVPDNGQRFVGEIENEIRSIIRSYARVGEERRVEEIEDLANIGPSISETSANLNDEDFVTTQDFFSDDVLNRFTEELLRRN